MKTILTLMLAFIVSASFAQKKEFDTLAIEKAYNLRKLQAPKDSVWLSRIDSTRDASPTMRIPVVWSDSTRTTIGLYYRRPEPKNYSINWEKVKTFNDLKIIIQSLNITYGEGTTNFKKIKKYLIIAK